MIGNLTKFSGRARAANLIAYMITAKGHEQRPGERVGATSSLLIPAGIAPGENDRAGCATYAADVSRFLKQWTRAARPNKAAPKTEFMHLTLSFHPDDPVTQLSAMSIAEEVIGEVVGTDRPRFMAVHVDKDHLHTHALISTVDSQGRIFNPRFDYRLIEAACESAELRHSLTRVTQRKAMANADPSRSVEVSAISTRELRKALRTGAPAPREMLKQQLATALDGVPSFSLFADRLAALGVRVVPHVASTGRVSGLSFEASDGVVHKGSSLGKAFTFGAICQTTKYEPNKDQPIIDEWRAHSADRRTNSPDRGTQKRASSHARCHLNPAASNRIEIGAGPRTARSSDSAADGDDSANRRIGEGVSRSGPDMAVPCASTARYCGRAAKADPRIGEAITGIIKSAESWAALTDAYSTGPSDVLMLIAQLLSFASAQITSDGLSQHRRPKGAALRNQLNL